MGGYPLGYGMYLVERVDPHPHKSEIHQDIQLTLEYPTCKVYNLWLHMITYMLYSQRKFRIDSPVKDYGVYVASVAMRLPGRETTEALSRIFIKKSHFTIDA